MCRIVLLLLRFLSGMAGKECEGALAESAVIVVCCMKISHCSQIIADLHKARMNCFLYEIQRSRVLQVIFHILHASGGVAPYDVLI